MKVFFPICLPFRRWVPIVGAVFSGCCAGAWAQQVDFTTDIGPIITVSTGYFDYNGDGTATLINGDGKVSMAAIGIDITSFGGVPVSDSHIAFCMELEQGIGAGSYTFDFEDDPANFRNGLTAVQVGRLSYLFDNYYQGPVLADWGTTNGVRNEYIFQLAVWEITHDTDMSLFNSSGDLYFTGFSSPVVEAQIVLNALNASGTNFSAYEATAWDIQGLQHDTSQDLVYAEAIPEPSSALLILAAGTFFLLGRRPVRCAR
ncbi:MAG: thioester domain-containing protein [Verrucomicrobiae bacterium]|nr:thioester domain-containing protein [Verrucomicrobiae bacterium]MCP5540290.1 Cys-Gln thioester bond-forming surface protein [Akkermansiaceae bacterium]